MSLKKIYFQPSSEKKKIFSYRCTKKKLPLRKSPPLITFLMVRPLLLSSVFPQFEQKFVLSGKCSPQWQHNFIVNFKTHIFETLIYLRIFDIFSFKFYAFRYSSSRQTSSWCHETIHPRD
jgi:hypothetical protein